LNSFENDRRGRTCFPVFFSMMDILSGASPLMVDVRQIGSSPPTDGTGRSSRSTVHLGRLSTTALATKFS
jgi:hypothetical protein